MCLGKTAPNAGRVSQGKEVLGEGSDTGKVTQFCTFIGTNQISVSTVDFRASDAVTLMDRSNRSL